MRRAAPAAALAVLLSLPGAASRAAGVEDEASAPPVVVRTVRGDCPSAESTARELRELLPHRQVTALPSGARARQPSAAWLEIADLGRRYRLQTTSGSRLIPEAARRCDERARAAAVFLVLRIAPPVLDTDEAVEQSSPSSSSTVDAAAIEPAPPRPAPGPSSTGPSAAGREDGAASVATRPIVDPIAAPGPPVPVAGARASPAEPMVLATRSPVATTSVAVAANGTRERRAAIDLDLGVLAAAAPGLSTSEVGWTGGAALRGDLRVGSLGGALGVAGLAPSRLTLPSGTLLRVPLDADLRLGLRRGRMELVGDVGLAGAVLLARSAQHSETRFEAGVRLAAMARIWLGARLAAFAALEATAFPRPYQLLVGDVAVGSTPPLWVGATLGITTRIR